MANILITDDEETIRDVLSNFLEIYNHKITLASSGEEAIKIMQENIFDIVIVDLKMGRIDGMTVLTAIKEISPDTEAIMITAFGTVPVAVQAVRSGAYDFIGKPINLDELKLIIDRALEKRYMSIGVKVLKTQVREKSKFSNIIGATPAMYKVFSLIESVCHFDTTALITGESGTGKELVARTIHANSPRSNNLFIPINCAAIPENLQESEFFGHTRGAFTDAVENKKGLFEDAHEGTVFLDEIADASPSTQLKLLRFLEDGEIRRVGENTPVYVNVRLIAATNKNLPREIEQEKFREDLYYRINVVEIHLPPLRERKDDIPLLAEHFLRIYADRSKKKIFNISQQAMNILLQYDWLGNIRELQSAIQYSVAFSNKDSILPESLPSNVKSSNKRQVNGKSESLSLDELKKIYMIQMLEKSSGNYSKASEILGVSRATIYRKLKEYGLR